MRRLIASASLFVLLVPAVAFAAPPDRDPAGSSEYEEYVILLPASAPGVAVNERDPAPRADDAAAGGSDSDDGAAGGSDSDDGPGPR
ncbi:MAG TPA: hypothetical protein VGR25_05070 [bacterium]|jgi:hypothetical protein|nr:hypothetical protein [bacterium]